MPNNAGTIETILGQLASALEPMAEEVGSGLIHSLGIALPPSVQNNGALNSSMQSLRSSTQSLPGAVTQLSQAISADNIGDIIAKSVALGQKVAEVIASMVQTANALNSLSAGLTPAQQAKIQGLATELAPRLLESFAVRLLEKKLPQLAGLLNMLGFAESTIENANASDDITPPYIKRSLHFDRIVDLIKDPPKYALGVYDWAAPGFDGRKMLTKIHQFFEVLGFPAQLVEAGPQPVILEAFLLGLQANTSVNPPGLGFELRFPGLQPINQTFQLPEPWSFVSTFSGSFNPGVRGLIEAPAKITMQPLSGGLSLNLTNSLVAHRNDRPLLLIGLPGGTRLEAGTIAFGLNMEASLNGANAQATPSATFRVEQGKLTIDFSGSDGFLSTVIPFEAISAEFSLSGDLRASGIRLEGSGGIELAFPSHITLGPIEIDRLYFVGTFGSPKPLGLELSSAIKLSLGPLQASVDRLGALASFDFPADGKGNLGPVQFDLGFKPPNGVGLSIDAGVVKGGGYLYFDFDKGEYAGALEINLLSIVTVKAIGIISTKMPDGSDGFSLLIILTAEFGTGIQLGFGFTLLGVGGLLGLNRTMKLETIAQGIRTGGLDSIMFPQNIVANAPRIISDLKNYFPPENDKFLIGPMVKIGWGTPTLISLSLGVIIEIPGNIAIVGILKVALPTEEAALILLQVQFIGAIEFDKSRVWFFASMYGSRILFLTIEGEMGLLMAFGNDANFVVSIGGFHPSYTPPPLPFPSPMRIAVSILNLSWARIRVEGYQAVTSNTVQFGAKIDLFFGFDVANISGFLQMDALFQFSPFYFIVEISGGVSFSVFGIGLFSVRLAFALEGPAPWRARGSASISLLFFDVSVDFDETWGDSADTTIDPIELLPVLEAEFNKNENWKAELPPSSNLLVALRQLPETDPPQLILHPAGFLRISQRKAPLGINVDKVGSETVTDGKIFTVTSDINTGFGKKGDSKENFAIAQYQTMKDSEKLSRPAYQKEKGGLDLSVQGLQNQVSKGVRRTVRYELEIIDTPKKKKRLFLSLWISGLFTHWLKGSSIAVSPLSKASKELLQPYSVAEKVNAQSEGYAVALQSNNKAISRDNQLMLFDSEAEARDFLIARAIADPLEAETLHVIPQYEMNN